MAKTYTYTHTHVRDTTKSGRPSFRVARDQGVVVGFVNNVSALQVMLYETIFGTKSLFPDDNVACFNCLTSRSLQKLHYQS